MSQNILTIIQIIIDIISAIATPITIIVAVKQYKKSFSINIKVNSDSTINIFFINQCSYSLLINKITINKKDFEINEIILPPSGIEKISLSNKSLKNFIDNKRKIRIIAYDFSNKKGKGKIKTNEIEI